MPPLSCKHGSLSAMAKCVLKCSCSFGYITTNNQQVVYNCFLWKVVRQNDTDVTSFCIQFEKLGRGLLFAVRGSVLIAEREGENKKGSVLENVLNTEAI